MATMPQDLLTFIASSTAVSALVSTRVHYSHLPQPSAYPHIWFKTTTDNEELTMDAVGGLHEAFVDLECAALSESEAQALADVVKPRLHGYKGTMGSSTAQGIFVSDKDDEYIPFSNQSDDGVHVVAFTAQLWYTT